jgi:hypothetical protein
MQEMDDKPKNEKGLVLGMAIIAVLIAPLFYVRHPTSIFIGIYSQVWGILFLLSYFYSHKTFFFRGLIWMCEHGSIPLGRKTAFYTFALLFGIGTVFLIAGLGLF